jgi:hypothetical protein
LLGRRSRLLGRRSRLLGRRSRLPSRRTPHQAAQQNKRPPRCHMFTTLSSRRRHASWRRVRGFCVGDRNTRTKARWFRPSGKKQRENKRLTSSPFLCEQIAARLQTVFWTARLVPPSPMQLCIPKKSAGSAPKAAYSGRFGVAVS